AVERALHADAGVIRDPTVVVGIVAELVGGACRSHQAAADRSAAPASAPGAAGAGRGAPLRDAAAAGGGKGEGEGEGESDLHANLQVDSLSQVFPPTGSR